jgi:hypothetical protein
MERTLRVAVVTTVTRAYLPFARVLMGSVREHHPEFSRFVLLLDGEDESESDTGGQVLRPEDLIPDESELAIESAIYRPIELATALKAKVLLRLLPDQDAVLFLDPDTRLFGPMTSAIDALMNGSGTLLTPHRLIPPAYEHRDLYEWSFKSFGTYNTGFVGVTAESIPFLTWWDSRLRRDCVIDLNGAHYVDQRIIDLAPGYFDIDIFRDAGYNIGWWNISERPLVEDADGVMRLRHGGQVVLVHFSGVRPIARSASDDQPEALPQFVRTKANEVAGQPDQLRVIADLERRYVDELMSAGYAELSTVKYGLAATPGGHVLSDLDRRMYRRIVLRAEESARMPPMPDDVAWDAASRLARSAREAMSISLLRSRVRRVLRGA